MTKSKGTPRPQPPAEMQPEDWNYETSVAQAEAIISQIEAGNLELEEVFDQFAAAIKYLEQCKTFLQERQEQADLLIETLQDES